MIAATEHPNFELALDVADKVIKLAAVVIGGLWTWWNYRKSRTYEQKLELGITGSCFVRRVLYIDVRDLFIDVKVTLKNIGATQHPLQTEGTHCTLYVIRDNLTEDFVRLFPVFSRDDRMEPGESINDTLYWKIPQPINDILWVKLSLRVVSDGLEWNKSWLSRVDGSQPQSAIHEEAIG